MRYGKEGVQLPPRRLNGGSTRGGFAEVLLRGSEEEGLAINFVTGQLRGSVDSIGLGHFGGGSFEGQFCRGELKNCGMVHFL